MSSAKRVGFISVRVSCITLKSRLCDIIIVNVHAPSEGKGVGINYSFYVEIE